MRPALAFRLALRELRGGLRGFRIFLLCLALGVAAIAGVGSLAEAISGGIAREGRAILGGDLDIRLIQRPASADELAFLSRQGKLSHIVEMRAMAHAVASDKRSVIELKAVDAAYPLVGAVTLDPALTLSDALAEKDGRFGMVAEALLADRLGLKPGDVVRLGDLDFSFRAAVTNEPDRLSGEFSIGPRVMISEAALAASGLDRPGSLTHHAYRLIFDGDRSAIRAAAMHAFPDAGWRIRDPSDAAPGIRTSVDRAALFLTLVGLTALVVGGVGVGNAVKAHLDGRMRVIAILKCLGAEADLIFTTYLIQILIIALLGIALGLAIGIALPYLAVAAYGDQLPIPTHLEIAPMRLALAALYGLLTAFAFTIWPLARARDIQPAALFRDLIAPVRRLPRRRYILMTAASAFALAALCLATTHDRRFALYFLSGSAVVFLILRLAALAVIAIARRLPRPKIPILRLALVNLHRPGAATPAIVLSLGLGLSLLVAVIGLEGSFAEGLNTKLAERAPSFFFVDIQNDQIAAFRAEAESLAQRPEDFTSTPSLRGRITRINDQPPDRLKIDPQGRWILHGDRGVTYAATPPHDTVITAGRFWAADYRGPPLIALDADLAKSLHIGIGDRLTVNVQGRDITGTIACLRRIDWTSGGINYFMVFSPGVFEKAPHTHLATLRVPPGDEEAAYHRLTNDFPNVTAIRVKEAIETVNAILAKLRIAILAASLVTIAAGILVLAGALAAGQRRRIYDAVVLKTLGMTRLQVLAAYCAEYALLGFAAAALGIVVGTTAAWLIATRILTIGFIFLPWPLVEIDLTALVVTIALGLAGTWAALSAKPAAILRAA